MSMNLHPSPRGGNIVNIHLDESPKLSKRISRWFRNIGMTPRSERHPNIVVRLIYATAHWFGDFAPIVSTLIHFFANTFGTLINFAILVSIVAFSIFHTIDFAIIAGAKEGYPAWLLTFVIEIGFIYSSILLSRDFKEGNKRSSPFVWAMFMIGLAIILVSNWTGMAQNDAGHAMAILIPVFILLTKGMLGHQFNRNKKGNLTLEQQLAAKEDEIQELKKVIEEQNILLSTLQLGVNQESKSDDQGAGVHTHKGVNQESGVSFMGVISPSSSGVNQERGVNFTGVNEESGVNPTGVISSSASGVDQELSAHSSGANLDTPTGAEMTELSPSFPLENEHSSTVSIPPTPEDLNTEESEVSTLPATVEGAENTPTQEEEVTPQEEQISQESGVKESVEKVTPQVQEYTTEESDAKITPTPQESVFHSSKLTPKTQERTVEESEMSQESKTIQEKKVTPERKIDSKKVTPISEKRATKKKKTTKKDVKSEADREKELVEEIERAKMEGTAILLYHEQGNIPSRPDIFKKYKEMYECRVSSDWFARKGRDKIVRFVDEYQKKKKTEKLPSRKYLLKKFEEMYQDNSTIFNQWIKEVNEPSVQKEESTTSQTVKSEPAIESSEEDSLEDNELIEEAIIASHIEETRGVAHV